RTGPVDLRRGRARSSLPRRGTHVHGAVPGPAGQRRLAPPRPRGQPAHGHQGPQGCDDDPADGEPRCAGRPVRRRRRGTGNLRTGHRRAAAHRHRDARRRRGHRARRRGQHPLPVGVGTAPRIGDAAGDRADEVPAARDPCDRGGDHRGRRGARGNRGRARLRLGGGDDDPRRARLGAPGRALGAHRRRGRRRHRGGPARIGLPRPLGNEGAARGGPRRGVAPGCPYRAVYTGMSTPAPSSTTAAVGPTRSPAVGEPGRMWKRVHLATIAGPDPGCVIELGAAGRGLPPSPPVIVGRGLFADAQIDDPHLSRQEFTARAGTRWGRPGAWIEREPARRRHLRPGARLRAGASTFEVRTDAARRSRPRIELAPLLPLAASLGFAAMWIFPGAGPWPLIAAGLLTPAGMLLRSRVGRGPLPDPAQLARLGIADPRRREAETEPPWPVDLGNAPSRRRLRPAKLNVSPGDVVALIGPGALSLARWVTAQLLSRGGQECPDRARESAGAGARYELRFTSPGASITLIAAPTPGVVPGHATTVVPVRAGHNRAVTRPWYEALARGSTGAELPEVAHLIDHLPELPRLPWARHDGRLAAPIGVAVGPSGRETATIDLSADAPHAVIAGTTGAGKSELLTSWLCGLAARYPPAHVAMVLVDYKGGATFGALARLPHVLEVLTDLEHPYTVRALRSLRVEI